MRRLLLPFFALVVLSAAQARTESHSPPLRACADGEILWSTLFTLKIFMPPDTIPVDAAQDPAVPKRIVIDLASGVSPPDTIPEDISTKIRNTLGDNSLDALRHWYSTLTTGDKAAAYYHPSKGVVMSRNDDQVGPPLDHAVIEALITLWLGPDPVSESLREDLKTKTCE